MLQRAANSGPLLSVADSLQRSLQRNCGGRMENRTKYRRSFDWSIGTGRPNTATASAAFARLFTSEYPELLEDLLEMSRRRRSNTVVMAKLQAWMLQELFVIEGAVKHYREKKKELEAALEKQAPEGDGIDAKKHLNFVEKQLFFQRAYANSLRMIGDGIAWRSLGYDRLVMKSLAGAATKPHVLSEGTVQELSAWSLQFDSGAGLAILNSLTNTLAIGDVTVVRNDETVEIIEVKGGKAKSSRTVRQKQRMKEVVNFISTGSGEMEDTRTTRPDVGSSCQLPVRLCNGGSPHPVFRWPNAGTANCLEGEDWKKPFAIAGERVQMSTLSLLRNEDGRVRWASCRTGTQ